MNYDELIANIDALMLDPRKREAEPREGQIGHCRMFANMKAINAEQRTIDFVCSTATVDRYGEIVEPSAFSNSIDTFRLNPAFPFGHSYLANGETLPTVGHWRKVAVTKDALVGTAWFKPRGLGEECWQDYNEGNLASVSVGFITNAWEMREIEVAKGIRKRVRVFTDVELLEISAVLIPANPQARIRAAAFGAMGNEPLLKRFTTLIERMENTIDINSDLDCYERGLHDEDADGSRGGDDLGIDYFGDFTPGVQSGSDSDDSETSGTGGADIDGTADDDANELKSILRDVLSAKDGNVGQ